MRWIIVAVLLAGCVITPEQRAENALAKHGPYCTALGFAKDSDQWLACVSQQDGSTRAAAAALLRNVTKP